MQDGSKKVLIVDDEPDVVTYLKIVLEGSGFSTIVADNARVGLDLARSNQPDLICLDIMMPRESGLSLYCQLRTDPKLKEIPVLIISGVVQEEEYDFRSLIPDECVPPPEFYLEKPIVVEEFMATVNRLVHHHQTNSGGAN